jgi:hypothetical protein
VWVEGARGGGGVRGLGARGEVCTGMCMWVGNGKWEALPYA